MSASSLGIVPESSLSERNSPPNDVLIAISDGMVPFNLLPSKTRVWRDGTSRNHPGDIVPVRQHVLSSTFFSCCQFVQLDGNVPYKGFLDRNNVSRWDSCVSIFGNVPTRLLSAVANKKKGVVEMTRQLAKADHSRFFTY